MPEKKLPEVKRPDELAQPARHLLRSAIKISLATTDRKKPWPFLSLTSVATLMDGTPILLLSNIAHHTRNIEVDPHVSLLFDGTPNEGNPLEDSRITLNGLLEKNNSAEVSARFMARHPTAFYAQFADFDFYTLKLKSAHFVSGFGATNTLSPAHILLDKESRELVAAETDILEHMNSDHENGVQAIAQKALAAAPESLSRRSPSDAVWQMTAIDPEGCDFMHEDYRLRYQFPAQVLTIEEIRKMLIKLSQAT